jgi:hypothetical protein
MTSTPKTNKRKHVRYRPEIDTVAFVDPSLEGEFKRGPAALVVEEAYGGCCLLMLDPGPLQLLGYCRLQVGKLSPMKAQVRWMKTIEGKITKVGFQYQE